MEVKDISIFCVAEDCSWYSNKSSYCSGFKDSWMQHSSCPVCYGCGSQFNIFNCCCGCHICEGTFCGYYSEEKFTTDGSSRFQTGDPLHLCKFSHSQGGEDFTYLNAGKTSQKTGLFSSIYSLSSISKTDCNLKGLPKYPLLGLTGVQLLSGGVSMDPELEQKNSMPGRINIRIFAPKGTEVSPSPYDFCNDIRTKSDEDDGCLREAVFYSPRYQRRFEEHLGQDGNALLGTCASDGIKINLDNCEAVSQCFDQRSELSASYSEEPEEGLEENSFYAPLYNEPLVLKEEDLPLDIENNAFLWAAPPPESEEDEFGTSGEDDDNDSECWSLYSSFGSSSNSKNRNKESSALEQRKDMRAVLNGQFRLVVAQLLSKEGLQADEGGPDSWLEIVTTLSLEAASVVKPDTSIGGGTDPGAYVKINCVASGQPTESRVVRGIVCKKNVAHKRMTTRVKGPRLLLLGGSLELHSVSNHLSSLESLLQQETDRLSFAVSTIEAHHPNVLLVEKTVSRQAQERLLARGVSLVLNIKRALLERIARCTGATIVSNLEHLASAKVGHCELFHVEKYCEEHGCAGQGGKKSTKTLMFFEECPKPFGCSILLKGTNAGELKKVKRAVKMAVFAAYHLALETSFLADEGVELRVTAPLSVALPAKSNSSISPVSLSTSSQAKNQVLNHPASLGSQSVLSTGSDLTMDHGISILREMSPGPSVSQSGVSSFMPSETNSPQSSLFKEGRDSNDADSVIGSKALGLQEVIGATLGKLSGAMALEDLGQGVINFTASLRDTLIAEKGLESLPTLNTNQFDEDKLVSMENNTGPYASKDLQIQTQSVPAGKMDSNSVAFGAHWSSQTSNTGYDTEDPSPEEFPPSPANHQSLLVSFSSSCLRKGTICERGHLFRIKYYGTFDKPLGRFLRETLFDMTQKCPACGESKDAHVDCYTHRQGCLTISVHKQSQSLSGESEGKIWMWHRCLRCKRVDGIPPATRRLVMSDAAWGLSFGKFLELSFSNHAAASKVASCGHSLHHDCLRFYGFGNMTACIRYSPVNVYSVYLPPSKLDFHCVEHQEWLEQEIREIAEKGDHLFKDILNRLQHVYDKITNADGKSQEVKSYILELNDILTKQEDSFRRALHDAASCRGAEQPHADILQLNYIRRSLSKCSSLWDNRLQSLSASMKSPRSFPGFDSTLIGDTILSFLKEISFGSGRHRKSDVSKEPSVSPNSGGKKLDRSQGSGQYRLENGKPRAGLVCGINEDGSMKEAESAKIAAQKPCNAKPVDLASSREESPPRSPAFEGCNSESMKRVSGLGDGPPSSSSLLSEKSSWPLKMTSVVSNANVLDGGIGVHRSLSEGQFSVFQDVSATFDAAWTGKGQTLDDMQLIGKEAGTSDAIALSKASLNEWRKQASPETSDEDPLEFRAGVLSPASTLTSPAKAGEPSNIEGWVGAPYLSFSRRYSEHHKASQMPSTLPVASYTDEAGTQEGVAVSLSAGVDERVVSVYDDEPTSVIAYAITSQEHQLHMFDKSDKQRDKEKDSREKDWEKMVPISSRGGTYHPFQSLDGRSDKGIPKEIGFSSSYDSLPDDPLLDSKACHVKVNFTDDTPQGKIKYAVTCYYAKQFDSLRKRCCRNELDFIRSLCRCKKWGAQGGKSNVFFAKTADDRFVVKQVTRTELDSFITFAPAYFKHMSDALITGSPTCLAKILGIYQVTVKHVRGGKELRMDLMIMENLLYGRRVSRVYDLKGSLRSRYADANAKDAVLLDQNLLESMQLNPIFISNKAKRLLERAVWNDTAFLALADVMDYSLLVGIDEERGELVLGIIDFMRQYTWDKHLETWVKASGILGGPKNAAPTVISPKQYKRRFRKAMSTYFLMVPDQWLSNSVISRLPCHDDIDDNFLAVLEDQSSFDHGKGKV